MLSVGSNYGHAHHESNYVSYINGSNQVYSMQKTQAVSKEKIDLIKKNFENVEELHQEASNSQITIDGGSAGNDGAQGLSERDYIIQKIMREKGVFQEVAEAEYEFFFS